MHCVIHLFAAEMPFLPCKLLAINALRRRDDKSTTEEPKTGERGNFVARKLQNFTVQQHFGEVWAKVLLFYI